jgi:hypothetical protein
MAPVNNVARLVGRGEAGGDVLVDDGCTRSKRRGELKRTGMGESGEKEKK